MRHWLMAIGFVCGPCFLWDPALAAGETRSAGRHDHGSTALGIQVWDVEARQAVVGRFGWKANQPNLNQQNAGAAIGDRCSPAAAPC